MRPRRTHSSTHTFRLEGGNEDNDLWARVERAGDGTPVIASVWELTDEERAEIAAGANIQLEVWGAQPPVSIQTTHERLGKPPPQAPI